jgi:hypothetical protein
MGLARWDIINKLIEAHNYKNYLEIGYYKGWSFDHIKCAYKIAVDPNPCKNIEQEKLNYDTTLDTIHYNIDGFVDSWETVIKLSSDDFFKLKDKYDHKWLYDIIFIDGLHEAEQVYRDIQNSIKYLDEGGTIVLHDMLPPTLQHTTTGVDGNWNGDCYKAVLKFLDNSGESFFWNIKTVNTDWGVGILQKDNGTPWGEYRWKSKFDYEKAIEDFDFFLRTSDISMDIVTPEWFESAIKEGVI